MKTLILSEFLKGRDVKINAVSNYISRNPDKFEGHITREGKNTILDAEAVRILEEKYPYPKPTVIINGVPEEEHREVLERLADSNEALAKAKDMMMEMQKAFSDQQLLLAEREHGIALLEERKEHTEEKNKALEAEKAELQAEIERLKKRSLIERILNKGV